MFLISKLSDDTQLELIIHFYHFLRTITNNSLGKKCKIPVLYHWGHMEKTYFSTLCNYLKKKYMDRFDDINNIEKNLEWYDLLECFKCNPIVINGCFKFGLKEIVYRLSDLKLINTKWTIKSECSDGNTAMILAYKSYKQSESENIPITKISAMHDIMEYNKIDCIVIHEIIDLIRKKNNLSKITPNKKQKIK